MTLVHENIETPKDRLVLFIPIKVIKDDDENLFERSQDVSKRLLENALFITKETENMMHFVPKEKSFFLYAGTYPFQSAEDTTRPGSSAFEISENSSSVNEFSYQNVVLEHPITLRKADYTSLVSKNKWHVKPFTIKNTVYFNNGSLVSPLASQPACRNTQKNYQTTYDGFQEVDSCIAPHIHDDATRYTLNSGQSRILNYVIGFVGLALVLYVLKSKASFMQTFQKSIGLYIWSFPHYAYITFGRICAILIYLLFWVLLYIPIKIYRLVTFAKSSSADDPKAIPSFLDSMIGAIKHGIYDDGSIMTKDVQDVQHVKNMHQDMQGGDLINSGIASHTVIFRTFQFITLCFTIYLLISYYIQVFGSPFKHEKTHNKPYASHTFHKGDFLCRNPIRQIGRQSGIDMCRGSTKLSEHLDTKTKKKFLELYEKYRRENKSAHDSMLQAMHGISPKLSPHVNLSNETQKINFCDMYNSMFSQQFKKGCVKKSELW